MAKKRAEKKSETINTISKMAISCMMSWAKESAMSTQYSKLVEKYIEKADQKQLIIAYAHIKKFNSFPSETSLDLVGKMIDKKDISLTIDFLKSKLRASKNRKISGSAFL